jgi:hypothetical protein
MVAYHVSNGCKQQSDMMRDRDARAAKLLADGFALRCSAMGVGVGVARQVHVLFRRADRTTIGRYMSSFTYSCIPLLENATPEDYERYGDVVEAPSDYHWEKAQ